MTTNNALKINAVLDCLLAKGVLFENDILLQADLIKDKHCHDFEPVPKERMLFAGITGASLFELLNQATVNDSIAFTLLRNEQIISVAFPLAIIMPENPILVLNTPMHHSEIRDIAVNKKKKMLVSVSYDKTMKIWNSEDLTLIKTLRFPSENGNPCKIVSTAISHQGDQIACCVWGSDWETGDLIFIVDTENFSIRHVIRNLENTAFDLEFSSDDRYLLAALGDCRDIMLFDTTDYHLIAQSEASSMGANSAVFLEDNDQILCVGNDSTLRLYLLEDQHLTLIQEKKYNLINPEPFRVAYSKANGLIALGFLNGTYLELLEGTTLETVYKPYVTEEMTRSQSLLHTLAFSDDGQSLFAGNYKADGKGSLIHWDLKNMWEPEIIPLDSGILKVISDANSIYFSTEWPLIGFYDPKAKTLSYVEATILDFQDSYKAFESSPDGQLIQIPFHFDDGTYFYNTQAAELIQGERVQRGLMPPLTTSTVIRIENWQYSDTPRCNGTPLILEDGEVSRCIAINPLETGFALGTDWHIYYYDQEGLLQWKNQTQSVVKALNIIKDGKLLMAAMGSGIIDFFRIADGVKLASLCVTKDRQWAFWTDEGYYCTSDHQSPLLGWVQNIGETKRSEFYPINRFYRDFYIPFLPQIIVSTLKTAAESLSDGQEKKKILAIMESETAADEKTNNPSAVISGKKISLHIVLCAVEDYQTADFPPLYYAIDDVTAVEKLIRKNYTEQFEAIHTYTLLNNDFSHENLEKIMKTIAMTSGDTQQIIFFYAGHGAFIREGNTDEYILKYPDTPGGIGLTQLIKGLESLQAAQTTLILDACNSGAAVDYLVKNIVQKSLHNQTQERPFNVITSSKQWEKSAEIKTLGHGLFTHSLLHAIRESATLDWEQIANGLHKQMRIDSQHLLGQIQFPGIYLSK